jgi:hypothetical protein
MEVKKAAQFLGVAPTAETPAHGAVLDIVLPSDNLTV